MLSPINCWLEDRLASLPLGEDVEGYLLGRGGKPETLDRIGIREWEPGETPAPHALFQERYGTFGEKIAGRIAIPVRGANGVLVGVEFRAWQEKKISEFRTPESAYHPFLINLPTAARVLWDGGTVWVVEGVYDLFALEWVVPPSHAVLSTLRAGFAPSTVEFFKRFCRGEVILAYDNDRTGRRATHGWIDPETNKHHRGALELLQRAGVRVRDYPYCGKDPGDVWRVGGARGLRESFPLIHL